MKSETTLAEPPILGRLGACPRTAGGKGMPATADNDDLDILRAIVEGTAGSTGVEFFQDLVRHLTLAVRELVANAIEWGHKKQPERIVNVVYRIETDRVAVAVRDTGPGFDRRRLPHAASAHDPLTHLSVREARNLREGGFGILMASGLVDELHYNDAGNEVTLIKRGVHLTPGDDGDQD